MKKIYDAIKTTSRDYYLKTNLEYCRTIIMNNVQITWFAYMYDIPKDQLLETKNFFMPSLLHLATMKAHAL